MTVGFDILEVHASFPMDVRNRYRVSFFFVPSFSLDVMCPQAGTADQEKGSKAFANGIHQGNTAHRLITTVSFSSRKGGNGMVLAFQQPITLQSLASSLQVQKGFRRPVTACHDPAEVMRHLMYISDLTVDVHSIIWYTICKKTKGSQLSTYLP